MRIAMIGQKGMPASHGGVERHVHDLAVHLATLKHDVTVYGRSWYTKLEGTVTINGVTVKHLPSIKTKHFDTFTHTLMATWHAITQKYDVIHYHGVGPALVSWIPRLFAPRSKVVTTFHSIDRYHQKWGFLAKWMLRVGERAAVWFAHATVTVSRSLQLYCLNEFERDTVYIPNGVNKVTYSASEDTLKKFRLVSGQYVLMVARLVPHKGAHILVDAFSALKQTGNPEIANLKLVIVGGSAYTNDYIKDLHEQASVCNDIVFTDFQSGQDLETLFAHAKVLVHPSFNEGLPITVLEAMNWGKPVLLSNIPEHLELVSNPTVIFNQNNSSDLKIKLNTFLSFSADEQKKLGEKNLAIIENHYRWETIIPQILEVYKKTP